MALKSPIPVTTFDGCDALVRSGDAAPTPPVSTSPPSSPPTPGGRSSASDAAGDTDYEFEEKKSRLRDGVTLGAVGLGLLVALTFFPIFM